MPVNSAKLRWLPGALLTAAATAVALKSYQLGLGSASKPGAGFFPFSLSVALALVAALLSAGAGRASTQHPPLVSLSKSSTSLQTFLDRKSTRLNSSHIPLSRMPSSA